MTSDTDHIIKIDYSKTHEAIYLSHLDTADALTRAVRRSGLPYQITQGCHVRPKISFNSALPLGHASQCEIFFLYLSEPVLPENILKSLSSNLPRGISILKIESVIKPPAFFQKARITYRLDISDEKTKNRIIEFLNDPTREIIHEKNGIKSKLFLGNNAVIRKTEGISSDTAFLVVEFIQGERGVPSVSKIITSLVQYLGDDRDALVSIERTAFINDPEK